MMGGAPRVELHASHVRAWGGFTRVQRSHSFPSTTSCTKIILKMEKAAVH
jgi:hypothetical protein